MKPEDWQTLQELVVEEQQFTEANEVICGHCGRRVSLAVLVIFVGKGFNVTSVMVGHLNGNEYCKGSLNGNDYHLVFSKQEK